MEIIDLCRMDPFCMEKATHEIYLSLEGRTAPVILSCGAHVAEAHQKAAKAGVHMLLKPHHKTCGPCDDGECAVHVWKSTNGVDHTIVRGRCVTCGLSHEGVDGWTP